MSHIVSCRKKKLFENSIGRSIGQQKWLSTKEAAEYLRITPNALRIWVCRGKIRAYKLGSHLRFRLTDLNHILQQKGVLYD